MSMNMPPFDTQNAPGDQFAENQGFTPVNASAPQNPEGKKEGSFLKKKWVWVVGAVVLIAGIASMSQGDSEESPTAAVTTSVEAPVSSEAAPVEAVKPSEDAADSEEEAPAPSKEAEEVEMTKAQENAVRSAENYLDFAPFSRQGLIDQLSSEYGDKYSLEDATFAVNHVEKGVDWNEQARKSAEGYLSWNPMSRQGLIDQLSSEYGDKYTLEQATAGVAAIEDTVDWNEQAAKSAERYLSHTAFSRQGLIDQLSSEYGEKFTLEQATYGVDKAGL